MLSNQTQFTWTGRKLSSLQKNGNVVNYTYNSDGIRTSKTVNGTETTYQLDETKIVSETTNGNIKWYIYDENDLIIGFEYNEQAYYFEKNAQGDVVRIFDSNGNFISEYSYDAWGNITSVSGNQEIADANPFRYRGYYYDNESGLYYLQSRYYDPITTRFLNTDEIECLGASGTSLGYNLFTYCENNPINYYDPDGRTFLYTLRKGTYTVSGTFEKAPFYSESNWKSRTCYANCYAYALNMYGNTFSDRLQPGQLSGKLWKDYKGSNGTKIFSALKADLKKISKDKKYKGNQYLCAWDWKYNGPVNGSGYNIAIFIAYKNGSYKDYHWYRKDKN